MRLLFVYYLMNEAGSAQDIHNYVRVGRSLGHEVVCYGVDPSSPFPLTREIQSADAVIFVFEWTTMLRYGNQLDLVRLLGQAPRERRYVIDCDGAYNDAISVEGDYNHRDAASSRLWMDICDSLSDKIYQPTLHPLRPNVRTFFFHGYDPGWESPLDFREKEYGLVYVGHSKFRWRPLERFLRAMAPRRQRFGRIALVGHGWDVMPHWAKPMGIEDNFYTDKDYLRQMNVEFIQQVPSEQVIGWMGKATFNPVIYRPLFSHLRLVTCRTFETPAANTIPLFGLAADYVREIYGERALELVLPAEGAEDKVLDVVSRPEHYAEIVVGMRRRLAEEHSYHARFRQLLKIVAS